MPTPAPPMMPILRPFTKGVKKSITLIPVSKISGFTAPKEFARGGNLKIFFLGISFPSSLGWPSKGFPKASNTRPIVALPTGISMPLPVASTCMPFSIVWSPEMFRQTAKPFSPRWLTSKRLLAGLCTKTTSPIPGPFSSN